MARADPVELYEIACFHCGQTLQLCIRDYRGKRYCLEGECRKLGYQTRTRERGRRYQGKPKGRENHGGRSVSMTLRHRGLAY